jgi:hypothetical protein
VFPGLYKSSELPTKTFPIFHQAKIVSDCINQLGFKEALDDTSSRVPILASREIWKILKSPCNSCGSVCPYDGFTSGTVTIGETTNGTS